MIECYWVRSGGKTDGHPGPARSQEHRHHPDGHPRRAARMEQGVARL